MPKLTSSAVNETMLFNVLQEKYWCPLTVDIRMKSIVKAPLKEVSIEGLKIESVSNNHCPLHQAQVHHALQGVDAGQPLHLLGGEDPFPSFSMGLRLGNSSSATWQLACAGCSA